MTLTVELPRWMWWVLVVSSVIQALGGLCAVMIAWHAHRQPRIVNVYFQGDGQEVPVVRDRQSDMGK